MRQINHADLRQLSEILDLGNPVAEPEPVTGGLLHKMWKAATSRGVYAIKELNPEILKRPKASQEISVSEQIASTLAKRGIPAVCAMTIKGQAMIPTNGATYLVYPWIDGVTLPGQAAGAEKCHTVGRLIGIIHRCDLEIDNMVPPDRSYFSLIKWRSLFEKAMKVPAAWGSSYGDRVELLERLSEDYLKVLPQLQDNLVVGHRDMDQKNIMWQSDNSPAIIDWEAAGLTMPMVELFETAFDWCGQSGGESDETSFTAFIRGYSSASPISEMSTLEQNDIVSVCIGARLDWLEYNMIRSTDAEVDSQTRQMASDSVGDTIDSIENLIRDRKVLLGWFSDSIR